MQSLFRSWGSAGTVALALTVAFAAPAAHAQVRKDSAVLGMVLEPTGLDPTIAAAAAIGEVVHYNVLEGLTKVNMDGTITPLLAESWTVDPDGKAYTFKPVSYTHLTLPTIYSV